MSTDENTKLIERAIDLAEEVTSHPSGCDRALRQAIELNDLDEVRRIVSIIEGVLSQEQFIAEDIY